MKLAFLTQYYPPETGAPQNRLHSLARHLQSAGIDVHVITAMPNYPRMVVFKGYEGAFRRVESVDGISVHRSWIHVGSKTSVPARMLTYLSFVVSSIFVGFRSPRTDYLLCESPPLFLGLSAVLLAKVKGAKLIFNVSDLWPESAEKMGIVERGLALRLAYRLEAWLYRRAFLVTGQTQGIVDSIARRFPGVRVRWLPNGVDRDTYLGAEPDEAWRAASGLERQRLFVYAGVLGHAQGLDTLIRAAARLRDRPDIRFVLIGDGPLKAELQALNASLDAGVVFVPNQPRARAVRMIACAYAGIVPLRKLDLFKGAIPSKIFDCLALGVPILLGVDGEARRLFVDQAKGAVFVEPEDDASLARGVMELCADAERRDQMGASGRRFVEEHFDRQVIAASFLRELGSGVNGAH